MIANRPRVVKLDPPRQPPRWGYSSRMPVGLAVVVFLMASTRWGAYLHVGPIFLTDILLTAGVIGGMLRHRRPGERRRWPDVPVPVALVILLAYVVVRGVSNATPSPEVIRGLAPYVYLGLGVVAAICAATCEDGARLRAARILQAGLWFHGGWFVMAQLVPGFSTIPWPVIDVSQGVQLFSVRSDIDTAIAGVLLGMLVVDAVRGKIRLANVAAIIILGSAIVSTGSRAGLIGAALCILMAYWVLLRTTWLEKGRAFLVRASIPVLLVGAWVVVSGTRIGERLISTFGGQTSEGVVSGAGTASARVEAWAELLRYSSETLDRALFGVGFAKDFMVESGALRLLVGEATEGTTRAPHNYWLNTYVRLGVVGLVLVICVVYQTIKQIVRRVQAGELDRLGMIAGLVVVSLLVPASLGVVLESPFGAIPFAWCAGVLLGDAVRRLMERRHRAGV